MAKARYYKADGKKGRARELPASLFDGVVNESVLHQVVKAHLANQRQGSGAAKNRAAVRGGSRKPWRQKGTGRARQGTIRASQWVGGGVAFPPQPHSWRQRVPRKLRGLARRSAFNARAGDDRVVLVDAFEYDAPSTKRLVSYLASIQIEGKVLILTEGIKLNVVRSARNVPGLRVLPFGEESPYDLLFADVVLIERPAIDAVGKAEKAAEAAQQEEEPAQQDEPAQQEEPAQQDESAEEEVTDA